MGCTGVINHAYCWYIPVGILNEFKPHFPRFSHEHCGANFHNLRFRLIVQLHNKPLTTLCNSQHPAVYQVVFTLKIL